jgi:hypothetical protein
MGQSLAMEQTMRFSNFATQTFSKMQQQQILVESLNVGSNNMIKHVDIMIHSIAAELRELSAMKFITPTRPSYKRNTNFFCALQAPNTPLCCRTVFSMPSTLRSTVILMPNCHVKKPSV